VEQAAHADLANRALCRKEAIFEALEILFASGHAHGTTDAHKLIELQLQLAHLTQRRLTALRAVENLGSIVAGR